MEIAALKSISVGERNKIKLIEIQTSNDANCSKKFFPYRFSHGEIVRYIDLKDYNKPNFSLLNQTKHPVLAKQTDNIWYKGRVVSSDFNDKTCIIRFEHTKKETKCDFHDILPIEEGEEIQFNFSPF